MKIQYRNVRLSKANQVRLDMINRIIQEYQRQGYKLTLRQLYYQLVSRDVIPNKQPEYAKLSNLLKEGRMGGIVDWDAIEDRLRKPSKPLEVESPQEILDLVVNQYALPRMKGQENYLEVWVEKDALSGVLSRVTRRYHINILVNRGYSSASAMFDAYQRIKEQLEEGRKAVLLYLGDYDPSGLDMIRDIHTRIKEFYIGDDVLRGVVLNKLYDKNYVLSAIGQDLYDQYRDDEDCQDDEDGYWNYNPYLAYFKDKFEVVPIALTRAQIDQYNPPPNPAKLQDPRAKDFVDSHGTLSWEVDALRPEVLNRILETAILALIDLDKYNAVVEEEKADIEKIKNLKQYL